MLPSVRFIRGAWWSALVAGITTFGIAHSLRAQAAPAPAETAGEVPQGGDRKRPPTWQRNAFRESAAPRLNSFTSHSTAAPFRWQRNKTATYERHWGTQHFNQPGIQPAQRRSSSFVPSRHPDPASASD
jgi:hypothetical protein